ncbi:MAG: hypothetical protein GPJ54_06700 [Candidatus Heimdallarchaeota archaeon]|nr:hypothetical protein [Candidatus Heimdallarchaeota archaeon]
MNTKFINSLFMGLTIIMLISQVSTSSAASSVQLTLDFTNLADPADDHYEGWLIVDGQAVTTGKFDLDTSGNIVDLEGNAIDSFNVNVDLDKTTKFVLTLEPNGDTNDIPASVKPVAGDLNADKTTAALSHNIGADFSSISGSYILATPTNGADTNENSGIWFLDPTGSEVVAGLDLPDLTGTDWVYEGWVVINGTPVTTGTFDMVSQLDDSDPYSSTEAGPPFPGEDFLVNAPSGLSFPTDIAGTTTVISIEPRVDNSPAPFQFKPLIGEIASTAVDHTLYDMEDKSSTLPTGTATLEVKESSDDSLPGFLGVELLIAMSAVLVSYQRIRKPNKEK